MVRSEGDYYGEWIHRGCGGNLIVEVDAGEKEIDGEIRKGLVFKLKCTKCPYEHEFAFLGFEGLENDEEGDEHEKGT